MSQQFLLRRNIMGLFQFRGEVYAYCTEVGCQERLDEKDIYIYTVGGLQWPSCIRHATILQTLGCQISKY
jgi:hypothetical protein